MRRKVEVDSNCRDAYKFAFISLSPKTNSQCHYKKKNLYHSTTLIFFLHRPHGIVLSTPNLDDETETLMVVYPEQEPRTGEPCG